MATKWVTREHSEIDRIARPWPIRRFIEADAEFLHVPADRVYSVAAETGAISYDIPGADPFPHDGALCSFAALIRGYKPTEPARQTWAAMVRAADRARHDLAPQAAGLHAISLGLSADFPDDHAMLMQGTLGHVNVAKS